jgi:TP901 family phage tail tape measure protein
MAGAARTIQVIVEGNSAPLQAAVTKAAESLKGLGAELAKQQGAALKGSENTIKSNAAVTASYERTAAAVRGSALQVVKSIQTQAAEQQKAAGVAARTSSGVVDAAARQSRAYAVTADAAVVSADKQVAASRKTVAASDVAAASAKRASDSHVKSFTSATAGVAGFGKKVLETAGVVGAASLYMSAKFQASTLKLQTQAGATAKQVDEMRKGILATAGAMGQTPEAFSNALYHVVSSMNKLLPAATATNEELQITKIALEGAAIGGSNAQETTYALASAMNALHAHANEAQKTMATLNAIVGSGDMTMGDLLAALQSGLIPTARTFGVSLQSVGAALAVMGDQGMRGALAGTRLRMSLSLIAAPSKQAAEMLKALGMSAGEIHARTTGMSQALEKAGLSTTTMAADLKKPNGIGVALADLNQHLRDSGLNATQAAAVMSRAFGGGRMGTTIELLAQSTDRLAIKNKQIGDEVVKFPADWAAAQKTLAFQMKATEGSLESLGIAIGDKLTPAAEKGLTALRDVADWLVKGSDEAHALEIGIGAIAAATVAAFAVNKIASWVNYLKDAAGVLGKLAGFGGATAGAGAAGGAGGKLAGGIYGARGAMLPGSLANPIVVAIESGQYAGLGGMGAATTAESGVKSAATKAAEQGVPLGMAPAAAGAETGVLASMRSGMTTLMHNALKGGMIGIGGILAGELVQSQVGGKLGSDIGGVLKDGSIGAAIGYTAGGPIGAAVAGSLGAVVGGIKALEGHEASPAEVGGAQAASAAKGMKPEAQAKLIADFKKFGKEREELDERFWKSNHGYIGKEEQDYAKQQEEIKQRHVGAEFGKAVVSEQLNVTQGLSGAEKITSIVSASEMRLKQLPPAARAAAANAIEELASGMEAKKELPKHSVQELVKALGVEFPKMKPSAVASAADSMAGMAYALKGEKVLATAASFLNNLRNVFVNKGLPSIVSLQGAEGIKKMEEVQHKLVEIVRNGNYQERLAAEESKKKLKAFEIQSYRDTTKGIEAQLIDLAHRQGTLSAAGIKHVENLYGSQRENIEDAIKLGVITTAQGTEKINALLVEELKTLGVAGIEKGLTKHIDIKKLPQSGANAAGELPMLGQAKGHARGGLVQLGKPGEAGKDSIPLNAGGHNIVAAPGEQVAVFTRHQQAVANQALAPVGGLPGLFSSVNKPHYMAAGGFAGYSLPLPSGSMMPGRWS